jgi:hypothetical protein
MPDHVYKIIEIVGSSKTGIEDAIEQAVAAVGRTAANLRWFEVIETRGHLEGGKVDHYQVRLKVGLRQDD